MNLFITLILLVLPIAIFAQKDSYIIQKSGKKIIGTIEHIDFSRENAHIKFKAKNGKSKRYNPDKLQAWVKDGREFHARPLPINKRKSIPAFLEVLSDKEASIIVYEYDNNYEKDNKTRLFLDRYSVLTEVQFGKFKKQLKAYFKDKQNVVQLIEEGGVSKKDLLAIVAEFNDVFEEHIEEFHAIDDENTLAQNGNGDFSQKKGAGKRKQQVKIWDFNDMMLSSEDATKKLMTSLEEELKRLRDENERNIVKNTKIGASFFEQKQYHRAMPFLLKAYSALTTIVDSKHIKFLPKIQAMLGAIYIDNRNYETAARYNSEALDIWKNELISRQDLDMIYQAYLNQAIIFKNLNYSKKNNHTLYYNKTVLPEESNWRDQMKLRGVQVIFHATEPKKSVNFNFAFLCLEKAEELLPQFSKEDQIHKKISLELQLGALHFAAGEYPRAKVHYETGLDLMRQNYDKRHPKLAAVQRIMGEIYLAEKLYTEALAFIEKAQFNALDDELKLDPSLLKDIGKIPFPFELLNSITTEGIILYEQNKDNLTEPLLKKVLAHYALATALLHELRNIHRREGSEHNLSQATHRFSQHAVIICNALYELTQKESYLTEAFQYAELSKSAVLYETVHDLKSTEVSGIPREEIVKENGLKVQIAYLKGEVFYEMQRGREQDRKRLYRMESKVTELTREHNNLVKSFEKKYPEYYNLKYNYKGVDTKALQGELAADEIFLEYVATDSFIYVLAIGKEAIKSHWTNLDMPLNQLIKNLQFSLHNNKPERYLKYGTQLYTALFGDLKPFLKDKRLIISADAELHYIPFGILPTPASNIKSKGLKMYTEVHYLIEDHAICYNYSASMYSLSKQSRKHNSSKSIATWAPDFTSVGKSLMDKGFSELGPLPGAQKEAELIADLFGSESFVQKAASEGKFKSVADQYSVLHIATHGILNDLDPIYSSLIMSNDKDEDGILHAFELYNMQLNADLAVLSACNSGMGHLTKEQGVVSIARGFSYAGVPNIVMSKWPVSDWATAFLMNHFYQNLKAGMAKDKALQQAKVSFLKEHRSKENIMAPFYWGGFVLSGNSAPIPALVSSNFWYYVLGLGLLLLGLFLYRRVS